MIKVAVIGCGRIGASPSSRWEGQVPAGWLPMSHTESLLSINQVEQLALCDSDQDRLKQASECYEIKKLYTDYRELIDKFKPDIITIATRTPLKVEIIEYACKHGVRGIYVEKPIANSMRQCNEVLSLVEKYKVKLAYGVNRRYHSVYRQAKELIDQNYIGDVFEIGVDHGKSQLLWTHPHVVDLVIYFTNQAKLQSIQSVLSSGSLNRISEMVIDSDPVIENAFFKFESGVTANINKSDGLNVRISGSKGNMIIHGNGAYIQVNQKATESSPYYLDQKTLSPIITQSATVTVLTELIDSVILDLQSPISLAEVALGIKMLMGCVWSHLNEGKLIDPSQIPENLLVTGKYGELYA